MKASVSLLPVLRARSISRATSSRPIPRARQLVDRGELEAVPGFGGRALRLGTLIRRRLAVGGGPGTVLGRLDPIRCRSRTVTLGLEKAVLATRVPLALLAS